MSKNEIKSKSAEGAEVKNRDAENTVSETREAITHAMEIADLQIELLNLDMGNMTPQKVETFFARYEGDPIAQCLKERMLCILKIRNCLNDKELFRAIFGLNPMGPVDIQATPVSISMDFYNPIDWARVSFKKQSIFHGLSYFLFPKGMSSTRGFTVKDERNETSEEIGINIDYQRAYGFQSLRRIKKHELRHSMNHEVGDRCYRLGSWDEYFGENDEKLAEIITEDMAQVGLARLKDELAAFVVAGNKSKFALKYYVFSLGPLVGMYNYKRQNSSFWNFWRKKGLRESVIKLVKKELPERINISEILERSYEAVKLLESKGYSREWAVSFLCADNNLIKDWLVLAETCPPVADRKDVRLPLRIELGGLKN